MQRVFFHVRSGNQMTLDEEGSQLPSYSEALREAKLGARDLLIEAIRTGRTHVPEALVISDAAGKELGTFSIASLLPKTA